MSSWSFEWQEGQREAALKLVVGSKRTILQLQSRNLLASNELFETDYSFPIQTLLF